MENSVKMNAKGGMRAGIAAGVIILIVAGIWFYSATLGSIILDNPTDKDIVVNINNSDYTVTADSYEKIKLPFGSAEYTVLVDTKEVGTFKKGMFDGDSLINPTLSTYISETYLYGNAEDEAKKDGKIKETSLCIDGKSYQGYNLVMYNDLYIKKARDYGLDKDSPDSISLSKGSKYTTKSELFKKSSFTDQYDESSLDNC